MAERKKTTHWHKEKERRRIGIENKKDDALEGGSRMYAVEMNHLSKIYTGGKTAVADMSLMLEQGEVF